ncbi:protein of unknown function [Hyphomicrobium sp. 1Nfss2.1]
MNSRHSFHRGVSLSNIVTKSTLSTQANSATGAPKTDEYQRQFVSACDSFATQTQEKFPNSKRYAQLGKS